MIVEVKNTKQIANIISKKMDKDEFVKTEIVKNCGISRNSIYKVRQEAGMTQGYNINALLKIAKEIGVKLYLEF